MLGNWFGLRILLSVALLIVVQTSITASTSRAHLHPLRSSFDHAETQTQSEQSPPTHDALIRLFVEASNFAGQTKYDAALATGYKALSMSRELKEDVAESLLLYLISGIHFQLGDSYLGPKLMIVSLTKQLEIMGSKGFKGLLIGTSELAIDVIRINPKYLFTYAKSDPFMGQPDKFYKETYRLLKEPLPDDAPAAHKRTRAENAVKYEKLYRKLAGAEKSQDFAKYKQAMFQLLAITDDAITAEMEYDPEITPTDKVAAKATLKATTNYLRAFFDMDKAKMRVVVGELVDLMNVELKKDGDNDEDGFEDLFKGNIENMVADFRRSVENDIREAFAEVSSVATFKSLFNYHLLHFMKADKSIEPVLKRYGYVTFSELELHRAAILDAIKQAQEYAAQPSENQEEEERDLMYFLPDQLSASQVLLVVLSTAMPEGKWLYSNDAQHLLDARGEITALSGDLRSLENLKDINSDISETNLLLRKASVNYAEKKFAETRSALQQALKEFQKKGDKDGLWQAHFMLGLLSKKEGNFAEAVNSLKSSITEIEAIRSSFRSENIRTLVLEDKVFVYEFLIGLLVETHQTAEALAYVERTKARVLLDRLLDPNMKILPRLRAPVSAAAQSGLGAADNEKYLLALEALRYSNPEFASIAAGETLSVDELQKLIGDDTVLLDYYAGIEKSFVFLVKSKGPVEVFTINVGSVELESKVRKFRDSVEQETNSFAPLAQELYTILIAPMEAQLGGKRLCIVPYGVLHFLPFQALMKGNKYLIQDYQLFYSSSASVLKYALSKRREGKSKACIIANSETNLPYAEQEAQKIGGMFTDARILLNKAATKKAVLESLSNMDILHFATHGILNKEQPLLSSLSLTGGEKLTVADLYGLELKANLVTLSACETHLGQVTSGDEVINLTRAFIFAGAPSIVTSLWRVQDDSTAHLMVTFYSKLITEGLPKGEALRQAQLEMLKSSGKNSHPRRWAPFVLVGDFR